MEILNLFSSNLNDAKAVLKKNLDRPDVKKISAFTRIIACLKDEPLEYADWLNTFRNQSTHPDSRASDFGIEYVIYANLAVSICLTKDVKDIEFEIFKDLPSDSKAGGLIKKIISYLNKKGS